MVRRAFPRAEQKIIFASEGSFMKTDIVIIGAGPAGIFTAIELIKKGSKQHIVIVEKGKAIEERHCPKEKTKKCVNCKP